MAQGTEFQVNTYTTDSQSSPVVSRDGFGNFVIAWESEDQDGSGHGIYAQRYNAAGVAQGSEFRVNSSTTNHQRYPAIGLDQDGDFVITWKSDYQDGSNAGIYAQRYNSSGVAQGTEFRVNSFTTNEQGFPKIGLDNDGDFVIAWDSYGQDGSQSGVYAKRFNAAGVAQGDEFRVNTHITSDQRLPAIGLDEDGSFVIVWESFGQGGSNFDIYSQRYKLNTAPVVTAGMFPRLPDWWRKSKTNPGETVANVIASVAPTDLISDLDAGSAEGFAVIDATHPNGTWEYSLDDGISWNSLEDASTTNARLLPEFAKLRFVPFKKKFRGDVMMTVVGWDRTGGNIGGTADITTRGGETSFSLETSQVTLTVLKKKPKF